MKCLVLLVVVGSWCSMHLTSTQVDPYEDSFFRGRPARSQLHSCHYVMQQCGPSEFNCACENNADEELLNPISECIPRSWVCDAWKDCLNGADEVDCICPSDMFQCSDCNRNDTNCYPLFQCIPSRRFCNYVFDCSNNRDEYGNQCKIPKAFECDNGNYILFSEKCNQRDDCFDGSDERNCRLNPDIRCNSNKETNKTKCQPGECYKKEQRCNGVPDCLDHSDERDCYGCLRYEEIFHSKSRFISATWERLSLCTCRSIDNYTCKGSGNVCYSYLETCDGISQCESSVDETNCACPNTSFTCNCFSNTNPACSKNSGCINMALVKDGNLDCEDGSDEETIKSLNYQQCAGVCNVTIVRLENETLCRSPWCDNTTCRRVSSLKCSSYDCNITDVVCTTKCYNTTHDCRKVLLCSDQSTILNFNFCNGQNDCDDNSDEITNRLGFKCYTEVSPITCVLPQWNVYDDIPHCHDRSDLCFAEDGSFLCFQCLDKRLILSTTQVCDGIIDCYDLSDECLCGNTNLSICSVVFSYTDPANFQCSMYSPACQNSTNLIDNLCDGVAQCENAIDEAYCKTNGVYFDTKKCETKWGEILAIMCDGRPECSDFSDECLVCANPPAFCNDACHSFYPIGDRYCDGYPDEGWIYLNNTNCTSGFDERNCPMRFYCSTRKQVSIDVLKQCNGVVECDDGSDEKVCPNRYTCDNKLGDLESIPRKFLLDGKQDCKDGSDEFKFDLFSSPYQMIANRPLLIWFWITAIITVFGNVYVIRTTIMRLCDKQLLSGTKCNYLLALNLSAADLLMGIYLLIIVIKAAQYSGVYSKYNYAWKTSTLCSLAGSISLISSQTSCFIMSILTAFRLFSLLCPFKARRSSTMPWKIAITCAWLTSIFLSILSNTLDYFRGSVLFLNRFSVSDIVSQDYIISFACRLASLTNTSVKATGSTWQSVNTFLRNSFPLYAPQHDIGYYGTSSMCIPKFYVTPSDKYWIFSISIITINFISFSFVIISYIVIWRRLLKRPVHNDNEKDETKMQNRIARLIATDFCCWMPICIMAYLNVSGIAIPAEVDMFTAGVLLPINSALNPMLYSPFLETFASKYCKRIALKKKDVEVNTVNLK